MGDEARQPSLLLKNKGDTALVFFLIHIDKLNGAAIIKLSRLNLN